MATTDKREVVITVSSSANDKMDEKGDLYNFMKATAPYVLKKSTDKVFSQSVYSIQRNFQLNDNYIMEREMNEIQIFLETGKTFYEGIETGAFIGAKGGYVGMAIGALIGGGIAAWQHQNAVYRNQDQARLALAQTTYNNTYARNRMGYALADNGINTYN